MSKSYCRSPQRDAAIQHTIAHTITPQAPLTLLQLIRTAVLRELGAIKNRTHEVVLRGADDGAVLHVPHQVTIKPALLCNKYFRVMMHSWVDVEMRYSRNLSTNNINITIIISTTTTTTSPPQKYPSKPLNPRLLQEPSPPSLCCVGSSPRASSVWPLASVQHMEVNYSFGDDTVTMDVTVDANNNMIHYYIPEDDFFEEVETIDDFYAGYAAVKVKTDEACYVQPLDTTLEEKVALIQSNPEQIIEGSVNSTSVLLSDDELEDLGDRVVDFCDGYPIYEVFFESTRDDSSEEDSSEESQDSSDESQDSSEESQDSSDESQDSSDESQDSSEEEAENDSEEVFTRSPGYRQVSVTFRKCVILFFIQSCCETTLTIPTGSSITFLWLFG
ncbi:uncharacterized protein LOC135115089 [Scylla paramamosain]|uniref:uncharacterized protein LOC135115089 n=1 Tax=Scylla paramamosain TaxID=85552 RepID=UPI003082F750